MEKEFKSFLKTVGGNEGDKCHYPTRLDLYGCGCFHDCSYCYAKSLLDFRKLWNPSNPSSANLQKVARAIRRNFKPGDIVRLGGMTDCFQHIEGKRKLTYNAIKELNANGVGYLIVTKSSLVASEEYMKVMDKNLAHKQISLTTTDDKFCRTYEQATPPSERIKAIERLHREGFDVQLRLSPFIPDFIDFDILNNIQCDKILVEFLRVNTWIKKWFDIDYTDYTYKQSGYNHLPLEMKIEHLKKIKNFKEITVCEDVTEHYDYWQRNVNHNPDDCCNLRK